MSFLPKAEPRPVRLNLPEAEAVWSLQALSLITRVVNGRGGAANYGVGLVFAFLALGPGWIPPSTLPWSVNLAFPETVRPIESTKRRRLSTEGTVFHGKKGIDQVAGFEFPWLWQCRLLRVKWDAVAIVRVEPSWVINLRLTVTVIAGNFREEYEYGYEYEYE